MLQKSPGIKSRARLELMGSGQLREGEGGEIKVENLTV